MLRAGAGAGAGAHAVERAIFGTGADAWYISAKLGE
jgi:hypothetical protein